MTWRDSRATVRDRHRNKFDAVEAERYDASVGRLTREDEDAYLSDLRRVFRFDAGMQILDAGAGTGTLSSLLTRIDGLSITALEPAPAMLARLTSRPGLEGVRAVEGFCDAPGDRGLFREGEFDAIFSRQLGNGLFDPLAAFENWRHWLKPGGAVVFIDGLYDRAAWSGIWEEEVDALPLSACRTTALVPYLLEAAGFGVEAVQVMQSANAQPSTRTTRYVVVARRDG
jgi:SAM-dependent methyltransferase